MDDISIRFIKTVMAEAALQEATYSFKVRSSLECGGNCVPLMNHNPCMFFYFEAGSKNCRCGQRPVLQIAGAEVIVFGRPGCRPLGGIQYLAWRQIYFNFGTLSCINF